MVCFLQILVALDWNVRAPEDFRNTLESNSNQCRVKAAYFPPAGSAKMVSEEDALALR